MRTPKIGLGFIICPAFLLVCPIATVREKRQPNSNTTRKRGLPPAWEGRVTGRYAPTDLLFLAVSFKIILIIKELPFLPSPLLPPSPPSARERGKVRGLNLIA